MTSFPDNDGQLLRQFIEDGSARAFEVLVRRHVRMVYGAALRQAARPELADEVTQAVFLVLARKAKALRSMSSIGGWLLKVTRYAAIDAMRKENLHRRHERDAARQRPEIRSETDAAEWARLAPVLDQSMSRLGSRDRDALVLRFFQDHSFVEVGRRLGIGEEAARKRVARALEKLRGILAGKGVIVPAGALGAQVMSHACTTEIPPALIGGIVATSSASAATGLAGSISEGVIHMMAWTKAKVMTTLAAVLVLGVGGVALVTTTDAQQPVPPAPPVAAQEIALIPLGAEDAAAAREAILARFAALRNFSVDYDVRVERLIPPEATPRTVRLGGRSVRVEPAPFVPEELTRERFSRLGQRIWWESEVVGQAPPSGVLKQILSFDGDIGRSLFQGPVNRVSGQIGFQRSYSPFIVIETILGLRGYAQVRALTEEDIQGMTVSAGSEGRLLLNRKLPVNRVDPRQQVEQWEFRPDMGYALSAFRLRVPGDTVSLEIVAEDLRSVDGLVLPHIARLRRIGAVEGQMRETERETITVREYRRNDPENVEARYEMMWPVGAQLGDARTGEQYTVREDGKLWTQQELAVAKLKQASAAATQTSNAPTLQSVTRGGVFAAPVEVVVKDFQSSALACTIDLDTQVVLDRLTALARGVQRTPAEAREAAVTWRQQIRDMGIDMAVAHVPQDLAESGWRVVGFDLLLAKLPTELWDAPDTVAIEVAIAKGDPDISVRGGDGDNSYLLGAEPKLPIVFAYRTREGGVGMLRVSHLTARAPGAPSQATIQIMQLRRPGANAEVDR